MSASIPLPRHEMSQCCRCGFQAVQPKLLPCLHTFCLQCLESEELQRPERSPEGHRMACPECSTEFVVPHQGLRGLPPDIFVERLVKSQKGLCDVCLDDQSCVDANVPPAIARRARLDTSGKEAWGVTWMNKYIYILTEDSVLIYDHENLSNPVEEIQIPQKKYLTDIAASPIDRCLYVTDQGDSSASIKESCIWKIEKGPDTHRPSEWLKVRVRLFTLSVSPIGHVTVPISAKGGNKLRIYSTDGIEMKEISVPEKFMFLNHAIELANGNFVVAFGKSDAYQHGVCEINGSGEVVVSFCDHQVLNHPWYVTVFGNEKIGLLLADSKNNRVLWLDSRLNVKKELLTKEKDGIVEPRRMCYAEQSNLLLIVHKEDSEDGKRVVDLYDGSRWLN